jgi:hypothetical protein
MRFALISEQRVEAMPGSHAVCAYCGGAMLAKCGDKVTWHWAHSPRRLCDPWWENETDWHRAWKNHFPPSWQEVVHFDPTTEEKHVADVKTAAGLVIEFQNSPMTEDERNSRENFYGSLVWVVNGKAFEFQLREVMPDPKSFYGREVEFIHPWVFHAKGNRAGPMTIRPWEPDLEHRIDEASNGHHAFEWNRARSTWLHANRPVYFDTGNDQLWNLVYEFRGYIEKKRTTRWGVAKCVRHSEFVRMCRDTTELSG